MKQIDPGSATNTDQPSIEEIENIEVSYKIGAKEVKQNLKYKMGGNFYVRAENDYGNSFDQIGDFRVMWQYVEAGTEVTVLARQMTDNDGVGFKFTPWNHGVLHGESVDEDGNLVDQVKGGFQYGYCCMCSLVNLLFESLVPEQVYEIRDGTVKSKQILSELRSSNSTRTSIIRFAAWFFMVLGHFLLFSPIIALLNWIPLVGWLLGGIVMFAALLFALVWGTAVFFTILCLAWLVFRPLFGLLCLVCVGGLMYMTFTVGKPVGTPVK